jgi:galactose mutarotase-like enzyme
VSLFGLRSRSRPHFPPPEDFGFVELRGGASRVIIVPSLGGKITALELGGRQWLWTSDVLPYRIPSEGDSYEETADTGGYDECFPTVAACKVPTWIRGLGGVELPDHGELWWQRPELEVRTSEGGQSAVTSWNGQRLAYRFTREVKVAANGTVVMRYDVTNNGSERMPFVWSSHPLLPMTAETRIEFPPDSHLRVSAQHDITIGDRGTALRWPHVRVGGRLVDLSQPDSVAKHYACKVFLEMREGWAVVVEGEHRLEVSFDPALVPNVGIWLNREGWSPFRKGPRYHNFGFEPCIGAPDSLADALGAWQGAHWLDAGETRRWTLTWRAWRVSPDPVG